MNIHQTQEPVLPSCEIEDEDFLPASEKDFDLAKRIEPTIELKEGGVYSDGAFDYYSVKRKILGRGIAGNWHETQVWARSYVKCDSGGRWEPDDYYEVRADDGVFLSLSAAVKKTKLDFYAMQLDEIDNTCHICDGAGEEYFTEVKCKHCGGKGFISIAEEKIK